MGVGLESRKCSFLDLRIWLIVWGFGPGVPIIKNIK